MRWTHLRVGGLPHTLPRRDPQETARLLPDVAEKIHLDLMQRKRTGSFIGR